MVELFVLTVTKISLQTLHYSTVQHQIQLLSAICTIYRFALNLIVLCTVTTRDAIYYYYINMTQVMGVTGLLYIVLHIYIHDRSSNLNTTSMTNLNIGRVQFWADPL